MLGPNDNFNKKVISDDFIYGLINNLRDTLSPKIC